MWLTHLVRRTLAKPYALPLNTSWGEFARVFGGAVKADIKVHLGLCDPMTALAAKYKSDKGVTIFPFHGYSIHYAKLFERFRNEPANILEIGLARRTGRHSLGIKCPSLSMWLDYFPKAKVYGFDIDDFSSVDLPRTKIFRGDQGDVDDLLNVVALCPNLDIIIDDGSHASYHQQLTLKTLFPHVASNGLYVIEDLRWQPDDLEASPPSFGRQESSCKIALRLTRQSVV